MRTFGIGETVIDWIKLLYSNASAVIKKCIYVYLNKSMPLNKGISALLLYMLGTDKNLWEYGDSHLDMGSHIILLSVYYRVVYYFCHSGMGSFIIYVVKREILVHYTDGVIDYL